MLFMFFMVVLQEPRLTSFPPRLCASAGDNSDCIALFEPHRFDLAGYKPLATEDVRMSF